MKGAYDKFLFHFNYYKSSKKSKKGIDQIRMLKPALISPVKHHFFTNSSPSSFGKQQLDEWKSFDIIVLKNCINDVFKISPELFHPEHFVKGHEKFTMDIVVQDKQSKGFPKKEQI